MPVCVVSFIDTERIAHSVEVDARSLYEAGAMALAEFRGSEMVKDISPSERLHIEVRRPATHHEIAVEKVDAWLASNSKSPREEFAKSRIREGRK